MTRRHPLTILTASMALGVATTVLLSGCAGDEAPDRTPSASRTATASPSPSASATATTAPLPTPEPTTAPSDEQTGSADDGTGPGTGNGSGVGTPENVDFASIAEQGIAAAGDGTVISLAGSGDDWTVVVAGPDGSLTQAVVSATLGRVTSGPFPKDSDQSTKTADAARAKALRVDAATAASKAATAAQGTVTSVVLGGTGAAPTWSVAVSVGGASRTVTVDGISGATS